MANKPPAVVANKRDRRDYMRRFMWSKRHVANKEPTDEELKILYAPQPDLTALDSKDNPNFRAKPSWWIRRTWGADSTVNECKLRHLPMKVYSIVSP